jgi:hypothetical protein
MNRDLDVLTLLLLDPCLTADEAAREAAARVHTACVVSETRTKTNARRKDRPPHPESTDGPPVGF